jgi:hypothetical protein
MIPCIFVQCTCIITTYEVVHMWKSTEGGSTMGKGHVGLHQYLMPESIKIGS